MPTEQKKSNCTGCQKGKKKPNFNNKSLSNLKFTRRWYSPCFTQGKAVKFPPQIIEHLRQISFWADNQDNPIKAMDNLVKSLENGKRGSLSNPKFTRRRNSSCFTQGKAVKFPPEIIEHLRQIFFWADNQDYPIKAMDNLVKLLENEKMGST